MKVLTNIRELQDKLAEYKNMNLSLGFVPTMGALHLGHLSLIKEAKKDNDICICSIYVNPTQFNNSDDLLKYPKQLDKDKELLQSVKCDLVFIPETKEMYAENEESIEFDFGDLANVMEGKFRPGHFNGVATIVKKFFDIIQPDKAYFGKKDYQQLQIIKSLCSQYNIDTEIIGCEIVREDDGLAMSSRNQRLTEKQRKEAPHIYDVLKYVSIMGKKMPVEHLKEWVAKKINNNDEMLLEYFELSDASSLKPINNWDDSSKIMAFIVVNMGDIRLIDNIELR